MGNMEDDKLKKLDSEVDDLLAEMRGILGGEEEPAARPEPRPEPKPEPEPVSPAAPEADGHAMNADDIRIDYTKFYGETPPDPADGSVPDDAGLSEPTLTAYEQSKPAYQEAKRAQFEREREQEKERRRLEREQEEARRMQELQNRQKPAGRADARLKPGDAQYADWLYQQGSGEKTRAQREAADRYQGLGGEPEPQPVPKKKKKGGFGRFLLTLILILLAILAVVTFVIAKQPKSSSGLGARKSGCSTILIAGTDKGGYRTDTMMLLSIDRSARKLSLVSIPRDTLVYCEYSVPKINSAYGWAGGGEAGMEELMKRVAEIIGFRPDGYVVMDLDGFEQLVDLMGGVDFNVPVDMIYSDPSQDLNISLKAGEQHLDGKQAMQVVRFRSGYATADLGRVSVQRDFVTAALKQWLSVKNVYKLPAALSLLNKYTNSDMSSGNYVWLAEMALLCDRSNVTTVTLPGAATYIAGGSYYVLDANAVAQTVNDSCNPYETEISASNLYIRAG
jgi:LCP family protein required for cell wall assembly